MEQLPRDQIYKWNSSSGTKDYTWKNYRGSKDTHETSCTDSSSKVLLENPHKLFTDLSLMFWINYADNIPLYYGITSLHNHIFCDFMCIMAPIYVQATRQFVVEAF